MYFAGMVSVRRKELLACLGLFRGLGLGVWGLRLDVEGLVVQNLG